MNDAGVRDRARALRNVLTNWGGFVANVALAFVLTPYVVRTLGDDAYGAWVLIGSLVGYLGVLDVGVRGAVTKYIATYHAAGRHDEAARIASSALSFFGVTGVAVLVASGVMGYGLLPTLGVPESLRSTAGLVLVLSGASLAVTLVSGVYGGITTGLQRFDRLNLIVLWVTLLRGAGTWIVLELGTGLLGLAALQLTLALGQAAATWWVSHRLYPELRVRLAGWEREHLRTILGFGVASVAINASGVVIDYSDSLVIGGSLSVGMVTPFAIAATLCMYTRQVASGISQVLAPMAGALEGRQELDRLAAMVVAASRFAILAVAPVVVVLLLRGPAFIGLWMGPEYRDASGDVLITLAPYVFFFAGFQVIGSSMAGLGRHRALVPAFVAEAVVNVALSLYLVVPLGLVGVALGTSLPRAFNSLVIGPFFARRYLGLTVRRYLFHAVARPALAMVPFGAATYAVERLWPAENLLVYGVQVAATLPLAAAGGWVVALGSDERRQAWAVARGAVGLGRPDPEVAADPSQQES